ncbi:hypothetical protein B0H12DRAFT_1113027 [Mycena haematopus]|nr:hypothetical protein B0H12DRAFT_1113027 [Mycena haematopus]
MALQQYPLDKTFIVAAWLEAILYGIYFCGFWFSVYLNNRGGATNTHHRVMFMSSIVMFTVATIHVSMNGFRAIVGYVDYGSAPGGPVAFLGVLSSWHHIFKDSLYVVQSILGDSMAVYRCWILWNRQSVFIIIPFCLLIASTISGIMVEVLFSNVSPTASIFDPRLTHWITAFYSLAVTQNVITTGLMALRLWIIDRQSRRIRMGGSMFTPVLRILVESAALYLFVEILLLALYSVDYNAQYILLETITPTIGITFGMITIRIILRSQQVSHPSEGPTSGSGTFPMRRIAVTITTQLENDGSDAGKADGKSAPV